MTLDEFNALLGQSLNFYNSEHTSTEIDEGVSGGLGAVRYDILQTLAEAQKEVARKNLGIEGGGGGGNFEAIYDFTTAAEIEAAYQAGMTITMNNNGVIFYLRERLNENMFVFTTAPYYVDTFKEIYIYTNKVDGITWSSSVTKAEPTSNKVTTIDANSTNKQYPSAKAVFDFVNENGGGGGADLLNVNGVIKQEHLPDGYPYSEVSEGFVLPETTIETVTENGEAALTETLGLVEGNTYTVNWNGTAYNCVCAKAEMDGDGDGVVDMQLGLGIGDIGLVTGGSSTGEPFVIIELSPAYAAELGVPTMVQILDGSAPVILSITGITEVNTPIAQKFLPVGYPYFVPGGEVIFPETTITVPYQVEYSIALKEGYSYTVNWNGTEYTCEAVVVENEALTVGKVTVIGNASFFGGAATNEPFVIGTAPGITIFQASEGTASLSITQAGSYLKMDEKYIPSAIKSLLVTLIGDAPADQGEVTVEKISHTFGEITAAFKAGSMVFLELKGNKSSVSTDVFVLSRVSNTRLLFARTIYSASVLRFDQIDVRALSAADGADGKIYYKTMTASTNVATQLVLTSPVGKKFEVTVDNSGNLSATEVTE